MWFWPYSFVCLFVCLFVSHASAENRSHYHTVMEDIIPLENALMTKQKVGKVLLNDHAVHFALISRPKCKLMAVVIVMMSVKRSSFMIRSLH